MKKLSLILILLMIITLMMPLKIFAHGKEHSPAPEKTITKSTEQHSKVDKTAPATKEIRTKTTAPKSKVIKSGAVDIPAESLRYLKDGGILALFMLMMGIGFFGFVGHSKRRNI